MSLRRALIIGSAFATVISAAAGAAAAGAAAAAPSRVTALHTAAGVVLSGQLPDRQHAVVRADGLVTIISRNGTQTTYQELPASLRGLSAAVLARHQKAVLGELVQPHPCRFRAATRLSALALAMEASRVTESPRTLSIAAQA